MKNSMTLKKTLTTFLSLTFLLFNLSYLIAPSLPTSAAGPCCCIADPTTGKGVCAGCSGGDSCSPDVRGLPCGDPAPHAGYNGADNLCDMAEKRYSCENKERYTPSDPNSTFSPGFFLCSDPSDTSVPNPGGPTDVPFKAIKGAWSEVFNQCYCSTGQLIQQILNIAIYSISTIALILLVIAGIKYITAQNNPDKITEAKDMATSAVSGMIFILLSVAILQLLTKQFNPDWGIDLLNIP